MENKNKQKLEILTPGEILDSLIPALKGRTEKPDLPTGITPLDRHIWGLRRKSVLIIGGRPAEGKSSLAGQIAWNLADIGKKVVYLSLEMSKEEIMERFICSFCDIDSEDIRRGKLPDDFDTKIKVFTSIIDRMNLRIIDGYGKEISQVHDLFEQFPVKPDACFIDHIQRIGSADYKERRDAITNYINDCEGLAIKHNVAMVICSQLNREPTRRKDSTPSLEDLKESGSLEETAGCVLLNHWPKKDAPISDPQKQDFEVIIAKQRAGASGVHIPLQYDAPFYKFRWTESSATKWDQANGDAPAVSVETMVPQTPQEQAVKETFRKDVDG